MIKLSTIKPNPNNPRLVKDDKFFKLVESIKTFGDKMMPLRPMVIDEKRILLGGNMRYKALKELNYKEVPKSWVKEAKDLSEDEKREFIIKDNIGFGAWDWDVLANEWDNEDLEAWGLDIPEFAAGVESDPFDDEGIDAVTQYGVIVMCDSEGVQESVFRDLEGMGFNCKIVCT